MRKPLLTLMAAATLAGCGSSTEQTSTPGVEQPSTQETVTTTVADAAPSSEPTNAAPDETSPPVVGGSAPILSITVGGMGAEYAPPTRCTVDLAVSNRRPTVLGASQAASGATLVVALGQSGVPADAIQTSNFWISPVHDRYDHEVIVGDEATIGYRVTMPDIDDVGGALARVIEIGGDSVRASGVRFEGDPDGLIDVARVEAWDDDRARAESTAELLGEPLGPVLDSHEKVLITSPQGMTQGGEGDSATFDIPVSPGVVGVTVLLTVTHQIGA